MVVPLLRGFDKIEYLIIIETLYDDCIYLDRVKTRVDRLFNPLITSSKASTPVMKANRSFFIVSRLILILFSPASFSSSILSARNTPLVVRLTSSIPSILFISFNQITDAFSRKGLAAGQPDLFHAKPGGNSCKTEYLFIGEYLSMGNKTE